MFLFQDSILLGGQRRSTLFEAVEMDQASIHLSRTIVPALECWRDRGSPNTAVLYKLSYRKHGSARTNIYFLIKKLLQ